MRTGDASSGDWFRIVAKDTKPSEPTATDVYIYDEIGFWGTSAKDFVKQVAAIDTQKINVHLNSPGGEVFDAVSIYNALKAHPADVTVVIDSLAASAASFIAQAGNEVLINRNATMMIHDAAGVVFGNAADMAKMADLLDKVSNNVADIYAQNAGGTVAEWRALMQEEVWYNAQEAVDAGLATKVVEADNKSAEKAKNNWDLSIFNHKGREDAPSPDQVRKTVLNRLTKEKTVGSTPTNHEEPGTPVEAPKTGENPPVKETAVETPVEPVVEPEVAPEAPAAPPVSSPPVVDNATRTLLVNGVPTNDLTAVQRHITALETAQKEAKDESRKNFVKNLVSTNRITAAQGTSMEAHALSLTDEQWSTFSASWEAAPTQTLLANHGEGTTNHDGSGSTPTDAVKERIETLEEIVAYHKRTGKTDKEIENMASWKELQALKSNNKS